MRCLSSFLAALNLTLAFTSFDPAVASPASCPTAAPFDVLGGLAEIACTIGHDAPYIAVESGLEDWLLPIASGQHGNGHIHFAAHVEKEPGILYTRNPNESYGTLELWWGLKSSAWRISQQYPGGFELVIGDASRERGGKLNPHLTHQNGRDVDVRLFQKGFPQIDETGAYPYVTPGAQNIDFDRLWAFIEGFYDAGTVKVILMDWKLQKLLYNHVKNTCPPEKLAAILSHPYAKSRESSLVRHAKNHYSHIHLRFHSTLSRLLGLLWTDKELTDLERELDLRRYGRFEIVIEPGDILGSLAIKHHVSVNDLLRWNHLTERSILHPGQKLSIYKRLPKEEQILPGQEPDFGSKVGDSGAQENTHGAVEVQP